MPPWLIGILSGVAVGLVMLVVNNLTTKSSAEIDSRLDKLEKTCWTADEKVVLERRLTLIESGIEALKGEVNFTKVAHQEFLRLLERALIPVAHSPHTPELDLLLEKRQRGEELTSQEWQQLIDMLSEEASQYKDQPGKQVSLLSLRAIYLTRLRQARLRETGNPDLEVTETPSGINERPSNLRQERTRTLDS